MDRKLTTEAQAQEDAKVSGLNWRSGMRTPGLLRFLQEQAWKHFHRTDHSIIRSFEPRENWGRCYVDEIELDFT